MRIPRKPYKNKELFQVWAKKIKHFKNISESMQPNDD